MKLLLSILLSILSIQIVAQEELKAKIDSFIQPMLNDYKIIETDTKINRHVIIGAEWYKKIDLKSKKLFLNKYEHKDYQEYSFTFVYFNDSDSCLYARKEYLNNYSWKSGAINESSKATAKIPTYNLITNNLIIIFEVSCEGYKMDEIWSWNIIKENLFDTFGSPNDEIIENGCGNPIIWINNKN